MNHKRPSKKKLKQWYIDKRMTLTEIGEQVGVSANSVLRWLRKYSIPTRSQSEAKLGPDQQKLSREELRRLYIDERLPSKDIAERVGVSWTTVINWLRAYSIPVRSQSEAHLAQSVYRPSDDQLFSWYVDEERSAENIAKECGATSPAVRTWLRNTGISLRNKSGMYDTKEARLHIFEELLKRSGKDPTTISIHDFWYTRRHEGTSYAGLLNWYSRKHQCSLSSAREYMLTDLAGLPSGSSIHAYRAKRLSHKKLNTWESFSAFVRDTLFTDHPQLNGIFPSAQWLKDNGYGGLITISRTYSGCVAVRKLLGFHGPIKDMQELSNFLNENKDARSVATLATVPGLAMDAAVLLEELYPGRFADAAQIARMLPGAVPSIHAAIVPVDFQELDQYFLLLPQIRGKSRRKLEDLLFQVLYEVYQSRFNEDPMGTLDEIARVKEAHPKVKRLAERIEEEYLAAANFNIPGYGRMNV